MHTASGPLLKRLFPARPQSGSRMNEGKPVTVPPNDTFGECLPWVLRIVKELHETGLVNRWISKCWERNLRDSLRTILEQTLPVALDSSM